MNTDEEFVGEIARLKADLSAARTQNRHRRWVLLMANAQAGALAAAFTWSCDWAGAMPAISVCAFWGTYAILTIIFLNNQECVL